MAQGGRGRDDSPEAARDLVRRRRAQPRSRDTGQTRSGKRLAGVRGDRLVAALSQPAFPSRGMAQRKCPDIPAGLGPIRWKSEWVD